MKYVTKTQQATYFVTWCYPSVDEAVEEGESFRNDLIGNYGPGAQLFRDASQRNNLDYGWRLAEHRKMRLVVVPGACFSDDEMDEWTALSLEVHYDPLETVIWE